MTQTNLAVKTPALSGEVITSYEFVGETLCNTLVMADAKASNTKLDGIILASAEIKTTDQLNQVLTGFNNAIKQSGMVSTSQMNRKTEIKTILSCLHNCSNECRQMLLKQGQSWQSLVNGARNFNNTGLNPLQIEQNKQAEAEAKAKADAEAVEAKAKADAEAAEAKAKADAEAIANLTPVQALTNKLDALLADPSSEAKKARIEVLRELEKAEAEELEKAKLEKAEAEKAEAEKTEADIMAQILADISALGKYNSQLSKKLLTVIGKA